MTKEAIVTGGKSGLVWVGVLEDGEEVVEEVETVEGVSWGGFWRRLKMSATTLVFPGM